MSNPLSFTKMHGTGNDFIVLNCIDTTFKLNSKTIKLLADRHFGIGFDQLLVVERPKDINMDFRYRIFNANGGEVNQCGNGARCFAKFVHDQGLTKKNIINVETNAGSIVLTVNTNKTITVNMGKPIFLPKNIPLNIDTEALEYLFDGITFSALSIGNPHAVIFKDTIKNINIVPEAHKLQNSAIFPNNVNVGFLQIVNFSKIKLRVYERGAGETLACGSGACAAVISAIRLGKLSNTVEVELLGGTVLVEYTKKRDIYLTGPAKTVFNGTIDLELFV